MKIRPSNPRAALPSFIATLAILALAGIPGAARAAPQNDPPALAVPGDPSASLLVEEIVRLRDDIATLRRLLAEAELRATGAEREVQELRAFVHDHDTFGDDFARYRVIREITEREARQRQIEETRQRREAEKAERRDRQREAREERDQARAEAASADRYRRAGFGAIGLDVYTGRMAFSYETRETNPVRVDYDPLIGMYYRPGGTKVEIDYGRMTISGSVLNAAPEIRNIGVAVAFFDEHGNQVGGEIVRINNARSDVPYPFTSTIEMALSRPFASSSTYVLFADVVAE